MKKIFLIGIILAIVAFIALSIQSMFTDNGGNRGIPEASSTTQSQNSSESIVQDSSIIEEDSNTIVVRIEENQVFVDGNLCNDSAELKKYIEQKVTDDTIFELQENRAILATYEWVEDVFQELSIDFHHTTE